MENETEQVDIKSLTRGELFEVFQEWDEENYRVTQVLQWLYNQQATNWEQMSNLSKKLRRQLAESFRLTTLDLVETSGSEDSTMKFLWKLPDDEMVESVWIPANPAIYGDPSDRRTLCVSTQVGCAYGCKFCASGLEGFRRNLNVEEIVEQLVAVERWNRIQHPIVKDPDARGPKRGLGRETSAVQNLVIMGMGEPLANYDNLMKALWLLNASWGGNIGARKITISTSGLVPQIFRLADEPPQFRLAISLHGATDEVRNALMPVNKKYPLAELSKACDYYFEKKGRMITLEYILIKGVNDGLDQIKPLIALAKRWNAKVNLIPYNTVSGLKWERSEEDVQEKFLKALRDEEIWATLRLEKGHDIDAACGQLRLKSSRKKSESQAPEGEEVEVGGDENDE